MKTEKCRSCHAPIVWVMTGNEKSMPVDAEPRPDGTLRLEPSKWPEEGLRAVYIPKVKLAELPADLPRYTSHFATCAQAPSWRRAR